MKSNLLFASILTLSLVGCSDKVSSELVGTKSQSGIIGGNAATADDLFTKSTVSLIRDYNSQPFSFCTGTLISKDLVMTATHCLKNANLDGLYIFMGPTKPTAMTDKNLRKVTVFKTHIDYAQTQIPELGLNTGLNDIALLKFEGGLPENAVPVPVLNDVEIKSGLQVLLAGYGLVQEVPSTISATGLNYTRVNIAKTYLNILVTDQNGGNGACNGDSGGPAYLETENGLVVLGVTRGPHAGAKDCRHFGEYTYASRYKDFILETAEEFEGELPEFVDAPANF